MSADKVAVLLTSPHQGEKEREKETGIGKEVEKSPILTRERFLEGEGEETMIQMRMMVMIDTGGGEEAVNSMTTSKRFHRRLRLLEAQEGDEVKQKAGVPLWTMMKTFQIESEVSFPRPRGGRNANTMDPSQRSKESKKTMSTTKMASTANVEMDENGRKIEIVSKIVVNEGLKDGQAGTRTLVPLRLPRDHIGNEVHPMMMSLL